MEQRKPVRGSTSQPDHIMLSISGDAKTTMTVTWRTSTEITEGYVEYWAKEGGIHHRTPACAKVFESDIDVSRIYWAKLTGLEPGVAYCYTCGSAEHRSNVFSFITQPEHLTHFKFLCVSDQQKGEPFDCPDYSNFNRFLKDVLRQHPDARFILTGGDNTDCGQHEVQWNGAFSGLVGIAESIPFMMTEGNHDNRGFQDYRNGIGRYYAEPGEFFCKQFEGSYPNNGPDGWKTENYAFDYGNAHFNVMGVNGPEDVKQWVLRDLEQCRQTWKFGSYHFPICYSGADCQNYDAYPVMREAFEQFDIVFSGHEHNFSRSFPLKNEELFDRPSQGTIHYMLGNSNQNPPGSHTMPKVWHAAYYPHEEYRSMVAVVEVDGSRLTITSVLDDGRIVDHCVIDKAADSILPHAVAPVYRRTRLLFKGMDPGLCQADTPCEEKDGVWFVPLAILIAFIGGYVEKTKGQATMRVYGHSLTITEGSALAQTDSGELRLPAPVYRGARGQLYAPADAVKAFEMRWAYAPRNNFISVEHESEEKPVTEQP